MDARNLDRAIDRAAGELIGREPSGALSYNVMARVRQERPLAPRRLVWATAVAGILLCAVIAFSLMNQIPATVARLPEALQVPVGRPALIRDPPAAAPTVSRIAPPIDMTARDVSPIEPLETEPIVMSAIDLPQLEREATSIDTLEIEPLTIAPLATSND